MKHFFSTLFLMLALTACQILPDMSDRSVSTYMNIESAPRLQEVLRTEINQPLKPEESGVYLLLDPHDAFVARATLIESAEHTLDMAYYIWHNDVSGKMLFQLLQQAAQRGVRVRLLLDDNNTRGMDDILAALNAEENLEIRLFNPFMNRKFRALGYLTDFPRLNRRMHNKSLTADNHFTIVGGRNIGDEYFNVTTQIGFADLDLLVKGKVVTEVSQDFDQYWASGSSYPFEKIVKKANIERGRLQLQQVKEQEASVRTSYWEALQTSALVEAIDEGNVQWLHAPVHLISDDPAKGLARDTEKPSITKKLAESLGEAQESLHIVSPYFVPTKSGVQALEQMREENVDITVLTNSLRATDVAVVHSGYARYRKELLQAGMNLYEVKPDFAPPKARDKGLTGSSSTSLHAKIFVVDDKRVFVGSFNFDPRSASLNTEMGMIIDSQDLAEGMRDALNVLMPRYAYRVVLDEHGKLRWQDPENPDVLLKQEPDAGFWRRMSVRILSILPIEGLL